MNSFNIHEQVYYNDLFNQFRSNNDDEFISGMDVSKLFNKSQLDRGFLKEIWDKSSTRKQPNLDKVEFFNACRYVAIYQNNMRSNESTDYSGDKFVVLPKFIGIHTPEISNNSKIKENSSKNMDKLLDFLNNDLTPDVTSTHIKDNKLNQNNQNRDFQNVPNTFVLYQHNQETLNNIITKNIPKEEFDFEEVDETNHTDYINHTNINQTNLTNTMNNTSHANAYQLNNVHVINLADKPIKSNSEINKISNNTQHDYDINFQNFNFLGNDNINPTNNSNDDKNKNDNMNQINSNKIDNSNNENKENSCDFSFEEVDEGNESCNKTKENSNKKMGNIKNKDKSNDKTTTLLMNDKNLNTPSIVENNNYTDKNTNKNSIEDLFSLLNIPEDKSKSYTNYDKNDIKYESSLNTNCNINLNNNRNEENKISFDNIVVNNPTLVVNNNYNNTINIDHQLNSNVVNKRKETLDNDEFEEVSEEETTNRINVNNKDMFDPFNLNFDNIIIDQPKNNIAEVEHIHDKSNVNNMLNENDYKNEFGQNKNTELDFEFEEVEESHNNHKDNANDSISDVNKNVNVDINVDDNQKPKYNASDFTIENMFNGFLKDVNIDINKISKNKNDNIVSNTNFLSDSNKEIILIDSNDKFSNNIGNEKNRTNKFEMKTVYDNTLVEKFGNNVLGESLAKFFQNTNTIFTNLINEIKLIDDYISTLHSKFNLLNRTNKTVLEKLQNEHQSQNVKLIKFFEESAYLCKLTVVFQKLIEEILDQYKIDCDQNYIQLICHNNRDLESSLITSINELKILKSNNEELLDKKFDNIVENIIIIKTYLPKINLKIFNSIIENSLYEENTDVTDRCLLCFKTLYINKSQRTTMFNLDFHFLCINFWINKVNVSSPFK